MGGMFGESKFEILKEIPPHLVPKSVLVSGASHPDDVNRLLTENALSFPLIFKPDIGERGFMVSRIRNEEDALAYIEKMKYDFIAQELVNDPLEFGVFYVRKPSEQNGQVISIVMKEMLSVEGDGRSTLQELIMKNDRAVLQWHVLKQRYANELDNVLQPGEKREIVSIGNHCLGTKFINANHLITQKLTESFDRIAKQIRGFNFGRFDLRCKSFEDLENGNVKILELNGCGAEPAHIYDPSFSFWKAVGVLIRHWKTIYDIAQENRERGFEYLPFQKAVDHYRTFKLKTKPS